MGHFCVFKIFLDTFPSDPFVNVAKTKCGLLYSVHELLLPVVYVRRDSLYLVC